MFSWVAREIKIRFPERAMDPALVSCDRLIVTRWGSRGA